MATIPVFVSTFNSAQLQLLPADTASKVIMPVLTAGSSGTRVHSISIAGTDTTATNSIQFWVGTKLTDGTNMGTITLTSATDTISRGTGSFTADGWVNGERLAVTGATARGNNVFAVLTALTTTLMTFASGTLASTETATSALKLYLCSPLFGVAVATLSGMATATAAGTASVTGLSTTQAPWLASSPNTEIILGPNQVLFASVGTTIASGKTIDITARYANY